jgi:4-hydroxy-3-methylbut-2-enyl diphosphate reductase
VRLAVLAPLRIDAAALRGLPVVRTGMGRHDVVVDADALAVAGFCGAVAPDLRSGDVVLATELRSAEGTLPCEASALLADPLERLGLRAHTGSLYSADRILDSAGRRALRPTGALAVDMESYWLAQAAGDKPVAVLRVVVDEADRRLLHPRTLTAGIGAFRVLRRAGTALPDWAEAAVTAETPSRARQPLRFALPRDPT